MTSVFFHLDLNEETFVLVFRPEREKSADAAVARLASIPIVVESGDGIRRKLSIWLIRLIVIAVL